jgi:hypothetical protein
LIDRWTADHLLPDQLSERETDRHRATDKQTDRQKTEENQAKETKFIIALPKSPVLHGKGHGQPRNQSRLIGRRTADHLLPDQLSEREIERETER